MDLFFSNDRDALSQVTFISVVLLYDTNCINRDKQEYSMETVQFLLSGAIIQLKSGQRWLSSDAAQWVITVSASLNLLSIIVCDICPAGYVYQGITTGLAS